MLIRPDEYYYIEEYDENGKIISATEDNIKGEDVVYSILKFANLDPNDRVNQRSIGRDIFEYDRTMQLPTIKQGNIKLVYYVVKRSDQIAAFNIDMVNKQMTCR